MENYRVTKYCNDLEDIEFAIKQLERYNIKNHIKTIVGKSNGKNVTQYAVIRDEYNPLPKREDWF
jgi:hypothetical protein